MIQFAHDYRRLHDFDTACPTCELGSVRIRYEVEYYADDDRPGRAGGYDYHSPEIMEQDCRCLLGSDFAQDALDDFLERPRKIKHGDQLSLPWHCSQPLRLHERGCTCGDCSHY